MKFDELQLCIAIENAGRCSDTPKTVSERRELAKRVMEEWLHLTGESLFPFKIDEIVKWDSTVRKNKTTQLKVEVAIAHGANCYWAHRGKGRCSEDVELGHVKPRSAGGELSVANCQIECWRHNRQRGTMTIVEYLECSNAKAIQ